MPNDTPATDTTSSTGGAEAPPGRPAILVGVDGSESSVAALRWACNEARLRDDPVHVVHCWHIETYGDWYGTAPYPGDAVQAAAEATVHDLLEKLAAEAEGLTVTSQVELGQAAAVLVEASSRATLLVVGRRGHGGFLTLVMGSVAQQVAAHAHCPVVIVAAD